MFVTADELCINYGISDRIARFFVDRTPPVDNLYWHKKLLYLRPAVGYLFIPLIVDLLGKAGMDKDALLGEEFVTTMEQIGHISALEETGQLTMKAAIDQCATLVQPNCKSEDWFADVYAYLCGQQNYVAGLASPFKALHRGDVFLFSLCAVHLPKEKKEQVVQLWFALITTLLLLDDADDAEADLESGDENAFLEHGLSDENITLAQQLVDRNLATIAQHNKTLARNLGRQFNEMVEKPKMLLKTI